MNALFRLFSLRHLRAHAFRMLLGLIAVALGVALFVASNVTTASVKNSMRETARNLAGRAEWRVSRGRSLGVDEKLVARIRSIPGAVATPIIQASAVLVKPRGGTLLVLGIDFLNDSLLRLYKFEGAVDPTAFAAAALQPDGIILTESFARANGLSAGSQIELNTRRGIRTLQVTGMLSDQGAARTLGGNFAIMEIHSAQNFFGSPGMADRIEVAGVSRSSLQAACPGYEVSGALRSSSMVEDALARIDSLMALSAIALLVGLFIIYNTVQVSVVERLKEIGILRAIGATRRQILATLLLEWLTVGTAGSAIGIAMGVALARGLLQFTARTINALVPLVDVRYVTVPSSTLALAFTLGIGSTLAATWIPARAATNVPAVDLLRPHAYRLLRHNPKTFWLGVLLCLLGASTIGLIPISPVAGLAATGLVFLGIALLLPEIVMRAAKLARVALRRIFGVTGFLAADNIVKFPQRTALTVVTLGGALAMMVATATVLEGFRAATSTWLREALPFDLAVMTTDFMSSIYSEQTVPPSVKTEIASVPGVRTVYGVRFVFSEFRGADIMVIGVEMRPFLELHRRRGYSAWARALNEPEKIAKLIAGEGVYVSDNFAALFGIRSGDKITLATPSGAKSVPVLRTLEDYSWPHGVVILDMEQFRALWRDDRLTYVDLSLAPGAKPSEVRARIAEKLAGQYSLFLYDKEQIRRASDDILKQTVAIADVQVIIAIVIGFLGIVNSLLISVLQRTREIGLLRAAGMTRAQLGQTVMLEGAFIAAVGGIVGLVGGLLGGWLPLRLYTFIITGFQYPMVVPWGHALASLLAALVIGLVASLIPARRAARLNVLDAIGYE